MFFAIVSLAKGNAAFAGNVLKMARDVAENDKPLLLKPLQKTATALLVGRMLKIGLANYLIIVYNIYYPCDDIDFYCPGRTELSAETLRNSP